MERINELKNKLALFIKEQASSQVEKFIEKIVQKLQNSIKVFIHPDNMEWFFVKKKESQLSLNSSSNEYKSESSVLENQN